MAVPPQLDAAQHVQRRMKVVILVLACSALFAATAAARSPTALRLEAKTAYGLHTDGHRYAVIERRAAIDVLDTRTGRSRRLARGRCQVGSVLDFQADVTAGYALLECAGGFEVLQLATGRRTPLPENIIAGGEPQAAFYTHLGAQWAVSEYAGKCVGGAFCGAYVNHRTGEQRLVPHEPVGAETGYLDLDDPALRRRRYCRPHRGITREGQRTYERPYLLDGGVPRRCGRRRALRSLPDALPDLMNLSAGLASWGDSERGGLGRVHLFDFPARRLYTWRVPQVRRGRTPGTAVHTRWRLFVAASTRFTSDGLPAVIRVYSARLPGRPAPP